MAEIIVYEVDIDMEQKPEQIAKMQAALEAAYKFISDEYYESNRDDGECFPPHVRDVIKTVCNAAWPLS